MIDIKTINLYFQLILDPISVCLKIQLHYSDFFFKNGFSEIKYLNIIDK